KIVIVGSGGGDLILGRYNTDGSQDTTFSTDGEVKTDFGGLANVEGFGVIIDGNGKIVVSGVAGGDVLVARFIADGSLDTTFSTDGFHTENFGGTLDRGMHLALQSDGKVVVAGNSTGTGGTTDILLMRMTTAGALDTSFDTDGKVSTDFGGGVDEASALAIDSNGKINIAGAGGAGGDVIVARYNTNGSLDTTFDTDGKASVDFGGSDEGEDMVLDSSGRIVVVGSTSDTDMLVARFTTSGALDTTFDTDGMVTVDFGSTSEEGETLMIQSDGKIVIAGRTGTSNSEFAVARLHAETTGGTTDVRHYAVQDANYNVTAVVASSDATVLERFQYDPYGQATVLDANFAADADGGSDLAWAYLHQGGRFDYDSGLYHFRNREYSPTLGRFTRMDSYAIRYVDGMNLYEHVRSSPLVSKDPFGLRSAPVRPPVARPPVNRPGTGPGRQTCCPDRAPNGFPQLPPTYTDIWGPPPPGYMYDPVPRLRNPGQPEPIPRIVAIPGGKYDISCGASGDCTPEQLAGLTDNVDTKCKGAGPYKCNSTMNCAELKETRERNGGCMGARFTREFTCFAGGDSGHQEQIEQIITRVGDCIDIQTKKGCMP
ncbi:MAG: RHS repeat-associated core domain-containing protein, partial [Tepidisphaeraceae bacterium]